MTYRVATRYDRNDVKIHAHLRERAQKVMKRVRNVAKHIVPMRAIKTKTSKHYTNMTGTYINYCRVVYNDENLLLSIAQASATDVILHAEEVQGLRVGIEQKLNRLKDSADRYISKLYNPSP